MALMLLLGALLITGLALTARWSGGPYRPWWPGTATPPSYRTAAAVYLRGVAVALVGGFWAGALVTGPAVRLAMRLLAVTAGDDAQGRLTEASEVVGEIELEGTFGLYVFGGILPGLISGFAYVLVRRWLPDGRVGALAYGALHLVVAATRLDPLRPGNEDFDLVGPTWLALLTFGAATVIHGMAVAALSDRYSRVLPPPTGAARADVARALVPLGLPVLILVPAALVIGVPIAVGLLAALLVLRFDGRERLVASRPYLVLPRVALLALALVLLPWTVLDLRAVLFR